MSSNWCVFFRGPTYVLYNMSKDCVNFDTGDSRPCLMWDLYFILLTSLFCFFSFVAASISHFLFFFQKRFCEKLQ